MQAVPDAASLPPEQRALIEHLFEIMGMGAGLWRAEFVCKDGRLTTVWKHHKPHVPDEVETTSVPDPLEEGAAG